MSILCFRLVNYLFLGFRKTIFMEGKNSIWSLYERPPYQKIKFKYFLRIKNYLIESLDILLIYSTNFFHKIIKITISQIPN